MKTLMWLKTTWREIKYPLFLLTISNITTGLYEFTLLRFTEEQVGVMRGFTMIIIIFEAYFFSNRDWFENVSLVKKGTSFLANNLPWGSDSLVQGIKMAVITLVMYGGKLFVLNETLPFFSIEKVSSQSFFIALASAFVGGFILGFCMIWWEYLIQGVMIKLQKIKAKFSKPCIVEETVEETS